MGLQGASLSTSWSLFNAFLSVMLVCGISLLNSGFPTATASSRVAGNETDQLALLTFKAEITYDPFQVMSTWNESSHFCQWQGITCGHRHQRVTVLDLHSQLLAGSISAHIGNLSFLKELYLHNNSFSQEIPPEIGRLSRLQYLGLENNSLGGQIPVNISHCSHLRYLGLTGNVLVGKIPMELGSLQKLQVLLLSKNNLTGSLPASLGNLSNLHSFYATLNYLEGTIPKTLAQLANLSFLALGANRLTGAIPLSIYNLSSLVLLSLPVNRIQGTLSLDFSLCFPSLQKLSIHDNEFTGLIPPSISNASNLRNIEMGTNQFTGKVPSLVNLNLWRFGVDGNHLGNGEEGDLDFLSSLVNSTNLEVLSASDNNLGGVLPKSISNLSTILQKLGLGGNQIRGSIPSGIGNLIGLEALGMERNHLKGRIPETIGKLRKLGELALSVNNLLGPIPSSLGNLTSLMSLNLRKNNLQGNIPASLGECQKLLRMALSYNNLTGTIPKQLVSLSSLAEYVELSKNHLTGSLPLEVGRLTNLGYLDISGNGISGEIPSTLGSCSVLIFLYMQGNHFNGTIPTSLSSLRGLQELDLSGNNLSGHIPKFFEGFIFLENLNLSFNDFEGVVPVEGVFKNASAVSIIGNTMLCGGIPELLLPKCTIKESKSHRLSLKVKLVIAFVSVVLGLTLIFCFIGLYSFKKHRRKPTSKILFSNSLLRLSFQDLLKATGGFSKTNLIGVGTFGSVYRGFLDQDETTVAVKVLSLQQKGASKSFLAECDAMRNIRHRNLVKILTACSSVDLQGNDFKALVYELMVNGNLEEWLHPIPKEEKQVEPRYLGLCTRLNIAIDVACALDYLHNHCHRPIIHCDLKPTNILLDSDLTAHVGDFGLARLIPDPANVLLSASQTSSLGIRGSVGYVAPEYGMGSSVSVYGDVYSYGILLLEMFIGKIPTDGMFVDGLNIHKFAKIGLPERVMEVVDPRLRCNIEQKYLVFEDPSTIENIEKCLILVLRIGVACSVESPQERMGINDVVRELHLIKHSFSSYLTLDE